MSSEISVIVPVYSVEKYLEKCIDSIIEQTYSNFELILINDGSPDNSGEICERYALTDKRIKVIHKENGGLASACQCGIKQSTGKYLVFVDSDDWIDSDMLQVLYETAQNNSVQIVACHAIREYKNKHVLKKMHMLDTLRYSKEDIRNCIFPGLISNGFRGQKNISNSRCAKLFDANLVKSNLEYYRTDIVNGEDLQLTFPILLDADSIFCIDNYYPYHYRVNENSITRSYINDFIDKSIVLFRHLLYISDEKNVYDFSNQLNIWFSNRVLVAINQEYKIHNSKFQIEYKIRKICDNGIIQQIVEDANLKRFSLFDKLIISLFKRKRVSLINHILLYKKTIRKLKKGLSTADC